MIVGTVGTDKGNIIHRREPIAPIVGDVPLERTILGRRNATLGWAEKDLWIGQEIIISEKSKSLVTIRIEPFAAISRYVMFINFAKS